MRTLVTVVLQEQSGCSRDVPEKELRIQRDEVERYGDTPPAIRFTLRTPGREDEIFVTDDYQFRQMVGQFTALYRADM